MRWWQDRRGHGPLRIPHDRRALRRAHPVERRLRAGRAAMLRARWRDLLVLVVLYLLICTALVLPTGAPLQLRGFTIGTCAGVLLTMTVGLLLLLDGSLLRRIGRSVEADVGDDLRRTHGAYGVISSLLFQDCDVDHVVLAPSGIWVLEVKWSMTPTTDLDHLWGLPAHLEQVRGASRKVTGLLRTIAPGVPVHPVLVLAGPGMPRVPAGEVRDGVRVVNSMTSRAWAEVLTDAGAVWALQQARPAAEALVKLRDARLAYELVAHRSSSPPARTTEKTSSSGRSGRTETTGRTRSASSPPRRA